MSREWGNYPKNFNPKGARAILEPGYDHHEKTLCFLPDCQSFEQRTTITKAILRSTLQQGHTLNDLLAFGPGQDCEIFKADKFHPGDVVIYVPDVALNNIPLDRPIGPEELDEVLSQCYTGQDFIDECGGDAEKAERLFCYCDWQHPSSAIDELADDEEGKEDADNPTAPSSTGGDYSPFNPWDAPGMSTSDFI